MDDDSQLTSSTVTSDENIKILQGKPWQMSDLKNHCDSTAKFNNFILERIVQIAIDMQQRKDDYGSLGENPLRSIFVTSLQQIFTQKYVYPREHNGRTDIYIDNPFIDNQSVITECLSWTTALKNPSDSGYDKKLSQLWLYENLQDVAFLITFITEDDLDDVLNKAKEKVRNCPFLQSDIIALSHSVLNTNFKHLFECRYFVNSKWITVYHLFVDLRRIRI
jgi:hypothetical protein